MNERNQLVPQARIWPSGLKAQQVGEESNDALQRSVHWMAGATGSLAALALLSNTSSGGPLAAGPAGSWPSAAPCKTAQRKGSAIMTVLLVRKADLGAHGCGDALRVQRLLDELQKARGREHGRVDLPHLAQEHGNILQAVRAQLPATPRP